MNANDLDQAARAICYAEHIHATHIANFIAEAYQDPLERSVILAAYDREVRALYRAINALQDIQAKITNDARCADPAITDAVNDLLGPLGL